ncbi:MAG TPA: hypothetical protein VLJ76_02315 [Gaiellaceae bacterium]|nr:hypothetical protein [Gaiellaceae bacterium]
MTLLALGTVALGAGSASAAGHLVPFSASFSGIAIETSPTSGVLDGSGNATHMGSTTNDGQVNAFFDQPRTGCFNGFRSTNDETFTAANGDTLMIHSEDAACPQGPGQFQGTGHWVVTGGTGRFSDAAGEGSYKGFVDFSAGTFDVSFTGGISY